MSSRTIRRFFVFIVFLFFVAGFYLNQRSTKVMVTQIQQMVHPANTPQKPAEKAPEAIACTSFTPQKGFIDLRPLSDDEGPIPWVVRGQTRNYTIGVCLNPVKNPTGALLKLKDGVKTLEIGAYYTVPGTGEIVLMGQLSSTPRYTGRKLKLFYENGSYCDAVKYADGRRMRQKTTLVFTCDHEMMDGARISYVAAMEDCHHVFEVRLHFACPTAAKADNLAAVWIFLLILFAALLVFFLGEVVYRLLRRKEPLLP